MNPVPALHNVPDSILTGITTGSHPTDTLGRSNPSIEDIASYDFSTYEYAFDPWMGEEIELVDVEDEVLDKIPELITHLIANAVGCGVTEEDLDSAGVIELLREMRTYMLQILSKYYRNPYEMVDAYLLDFIEGQLPLVYRTMTELKTNEQRERYYRDYIVPMMREWLREKTVSMIGKKPPQDSEARDELLKHAEQVITGRVQKESYGFRPFYQGVINLGLRVTYRQEWRSLGNQDGEIVRTIPLGPGQSEKVSERFMRRNKGTRQMESLTSLETTRETSVNQQDSSEVVEETASNQKWNVESEAEGGIAGIFSAKVSGGYASDSAQSSKATKARLAESMEKTASKMRSETKVVVSTEHEMTYEETRASEIHNPNDEVAVTYIYQKLLRHYTLHTYLAEVAGVVFIAEPLPEPGSINIKWVRQHDWILAKVLLDESFRETLNEISSGVAGSPAAASSEASILSGVVNKVGNSIGNISGLTGTISNIYDGAISNYREAARQERERQEQYGLRSLRIDRFLDHLRANILHYYRAIWRQEDPEARQMRYMEVYIPSAYEFVPTSTPTPPTETAGTGIAGEWKPKTDAPQVRLSDVIHPAGPIGFAGNYAIYYLRNGAEHQLDRVVDQLKLRYLTDPTLIVEPGSENKNKTTHIVQAVISDPQKITYKPYCLSYEKKDEQLRYTLSRMERDESLTMIIHDVAITGDLPFVSEGFTLKIQSLPEVGDFFWIQPQPFEVLDPEIKEICKQRPLPVPGSQQEAAVFNPETLKNMLTEVPLLAERVAELSDGSQAAGFETKWFELNAVQKNLMRANYHVYWLRRVNTTHILVDTNNLVLNLDTGKGSILEDFKRAHRYLDVAKANYEVERRRKLVKKGNLAQPEVERVIITHGDPGEVAAITAGFVGAAGGGGASKIEKVEISTAPGEGTP